MMSMAGRKLSIEDEIMQLIERTDQIKKCFERFGRWDFENIEIQEKLSEFSKEDFPNIVEKQLIRYIDNRNKDELKEKYAGFITSLRKVTHLYRRNKDFFDGHNREKSYNWMVRKMFDDEIEILEKDIADTLIYNPDKDNIVSDFKDNKVKLETQKIEFHRANFVRYTSNHHKEIYSVFNDTLKRINRYLSNHATSIHSRKHLAHAFELFNGKLWEAATLNHFEDFMNFPEETDSIDIREKVKFNLLMYYFSKIIDNKDVKKAWIASTNNVVGTNITKKKRLSDDSKDSDVFMSELKEIFGNIVDEKKERKNKSK